MENNIIDVEFKEIDLLSDKPTETLAAEANHLWEQMELIGAIGIQLAAQAGDRLNIIKERLPHGQWEAWAKDNLSFSLRKAKNMMQLAKKVGDENSIFSNRQTFADIGISKIYALLGTDEEVAKEVLENPDASEISVREFKEKIKELEAEKEENRRDQIAIQERFMEESKRTEQLEIEIGNQNDIIAELNKKIGELEIKAEKEPEKVIDTEEIERLSKKLAETEEQVEKEKKLLQQEQEKRKEELKKSVDMARAENERLLEIQEEEKKKHAAEIEKLKLNAKKTDQTDLVEFKIKSNMLQSDFNECLKSVEKVKKENPEQAGKMKAALIKVMMILTDKLGD